MMTIKDGKDYISQVRELIIEYTKRLDRDLSFQNINEELENLAIKYTAPEGEFKIADDIRCQPIDYFKERCPVGYEWLKDNGFETIEDVIARQNEMPIDYKGENINGTIKGILIGWL